MYSHKKACEAISAVKTEGDMVALLVGLTDTIGWWESDAERILKMREDAARWHEELKEDYANARLQRQIYKQEAFDLKEERDQLVDENLELMTSLERSYGIIAAVEQIIGTSR